MTATTRHYFPGNNTPQGFFSYYPHILDQRRAQKIYCLKGGPGLGKSTLMRQIGEALLADGEDVDFLHCSSDPDSLDGILIRSKNAAMVDGTSPHIVDPIHPGAVDEIVNLGEFWDETGIRAHRQEILDTGDRMKTHYARAYSYLAAAGSLNTGLNKLYDDHLDHPRLYKKAASILNKEFSHKKLSATPGTVRRQFASALTPNGSVSYLPGLMADAGRIYLLQTPAGLSGQRLISLVLDHALTRGFDVEAYHDPMVPAGTPEHLYIPQLKLAFVTSDPWHPVEKSDFEGRVTVVDFHRWLHLKDDEIASAHAAQMTDLMDQLIRCAFQCFREAKTDHDRLEQFYIPHVDFSRTEPLKQKILWEIRQL